MKTMWTVIVAVLASGFLAGPGVLRARAAEIDRLFSQFNSQMGESTYREAEATARKMLTNSYTDGWKAASYNCLGRACEGLARYDDAIKAYRDALRYRLASDNINLAWIPNNLGLVYLAKQDYAEAERYFKQAKSAFLRLRGEKSSEFATCCMNLGKLYFETNRYDESERLVSQALAARKAIYGDEHSMVAGSLCRLGQLENARKHYPQAESYFKQALALHEKLSGPETVDTRCEVFKLAKLYRDQGEFSEAEPFDRRSLAIAEKIYGINHKYVAADLEHLAEDLESLNRSSEAAPLRERANALRADSASNTPVRVPVLVHAKTASVSNGSKVLTTLKRGTQFDVIAVKGKWCGVRTEVDGEPITGWVRDVDLVSMASQTTMPATDRNTASTSRWTQLKPAAANAEIAFPRSPKATTVTVNGVTMYGYACDTSNSHYLFSYFDVPPGNVLTFDAAINAYATRRDGSVESQKKVILDENLGQEFLVRLPDHSVSRMCLLHVDRRWYQIAVDGNAEVVRGAEANQFFDSFKLAD